MNTLKTAAQQALLNFENMAESNWRNWQELASAEEFEKWVKRRASHMVANLRTALADEQAQAVEPATTPSRRNRTAQEFKFGMEVLNWNRAQQDPPIDLGRELWVSDEVLKLIGTTQHRPAPPAPTTRPLTPAEKSELLEAGVTGECVRVLAFNDRPATGERAELITKLRENHSKRFVISPSIFSKAADMLEADAQELAALHRNRHAREDVISGLKDEIEAQQVAVPVPMSWYEISKWWASENGLEDCNMYIHGDFEKVVRAIEARHRIGTAP